MLLMKMINKERNPEIIGYFIENNEIVVANPCKIPIEMLEDNIKQHKKRKDKKGVEIVALIKLPNILKK